jgi:hypothetical protein
MANDGSGHRRALQEELVGDDLRSVERLKAGPVEAVWRDVASEVKADLSEEPVRSEPVRADDGLAEDLASLAERSPPAAVLEGYVRMTDALRRVVEDPPADPNLDLSKFSARSLAGLALEHGRITAKTAQAVDGLGVMRNLVAHGRGGEITTQEALDYLHLVDATLFAIRMNLDDWRKSRGSGLQDD